MAIRIRENQANVHGDNRGRSTIIIWLKSRKTQRIREALHNTAEPIQIFMLHEIRQVGDTDTGGRRNSVDDSCGRIRLGRSYLVSSPDTWT